MKMQMCTYVRRYGLYGKRTLIQAGKSQTIYECVYVGAMLKII